MDTLARIKSRGVEHEKSAPLLAVSELSARYAPGADAGLMGGERRNGERYALKDVSFRVEGGERVAVVGPNGAGKSTLFKVIAGTMRPRSGHIEVFGHDPDEHICIAYVPQRSQIDWSFPVTVEDVVMMGRIRQIGLFRRPRRRDWQIVRQSLRRVNADSLARKQIGELSGGQQQRVFIARALAQRAELLLLDEPITGLDVTSQELFFSVLDSLHEDGVTVMLATHDLNLAAERFDRIMLLNRRLIAFGPAGAVLSSQNLMGAYGGQMHVIDGEEGTVIVADTCCEGDEAHRP